MKSFAITLVVMAYCTASHADSRNANFAVTATVTKACSITGAPVSFGSLNVLSASPADATATLTSTCSPGSAYTIGLGAGTLSPAGMNWGAIGEPGVATGRGTGLPQVTTVRGRIPAEQRSVAVGSYSDFIVATIDF